MAKVAEQWGDYREAVIILNEESLPLISARGGLINYGFSKIELRVYKSDSRTTANPPTDSIPANPVIFQPILLETTPPVPIPEPIPKPSPEPTEPVEDV